MYREESKQVNHVFENSAPSIDTMKIPANLPAEKHSFFSGSSFLC